MSRLACVVVCLMQLFNYINSEGHYTVSAPGAIRSNSEYHVAVSVHDSAEPCSMKVGIVGSQYTDYKTLEVQPHSTELVKFDLPSLIKDNYNLTVEGLSGIIFKNESNLNFQEKEYTVLIQTDKATYKPGDLVKYRILVLDHNTRPVNVERDVDVSIQDGKENKIKLMKKITFTKGVHSDELQLSSLPVLGDWKITVDINNNKYTKDFEVAEYVLPKFEVVVESAENAFFDDKKVHATVRAKYTYGKPVIGDATVSVYRHYYGPPTESNLLTRKVVPLDGKARLEFDIENDFNMKENFHYNNVLIHASVEEKLTGLKQNSSTEVNIRKNRYIVSAVKMPNIYVPGVPFEVKVQVTTLDGKPVQDTTHPVTAGIFITFNKRINDTEAYLDKNGIATFEFQLPASDEIVYAYIFATYRGEDQNIGGPRLREDGKANDIQLEVLTEEPTITGDVSVAVTSNKDMNYLMYQVIGRGDILISKIEQFADTKHHILKFPASFAMTPTAKLFVSTVRDGEIYFDEKTINFGENLSNFVKIEVPAQAEPGENVQLTVSTNPNSFVGLLGVDQSVLVLKSGNDLTPSRVFEELKQYDSSVPFMKGRGRVPGRDSGLVTLTNAFYPYDKDYVEIIYYDAIPMVVSYRGGPPLPTELSTPIKTRTEFPESWIWESFEKLVKLYFSLSFAVYF